MPFSLRLHSDRHPFVQQIEPRKSAEIEDLVPMMNTGTILHAREGDTSLNEAIMT